MDISERAEQIFAEAQELPADQRLAFAQQACAGEALLFAEVSSLLQAAAESEGYFERLSARVGLKALAEDEEPLPENKVVGHWRLRTLLGRGGMGSVYLAERADDQFEQQAALKILPFGLDSEAARARFLTERQILARLTHDNIARLLDGGVTDEGMPFFVMDYVDGQSIDAYCDVNRLAIHARIELFLGVLAAVAHAHSHLIVHRDIKPSNVLVTREGTVKLLDFGVAKLLSSEAGRQTRELGVALTPEFAAPEQLSGAAITTAADIYSLGLLLFALLAGRNPRSLQPTDSLLGLHAAATGEPPRLSTFATDGDGVDAADMAKIVASRATSEPALRRTLKGDLDNILQKALAVDPQRRYATVTEFAADLKRFLSDEPVTARPPTVTYRVNKFVRRHRGSVLMATLLAVALLASTVINAWQAAEARRQRDFALEQQRRVEATNTFLSLLLNEVGATGEPLSLIDLLDRGVDMLNRRYGVEDAFVASTLVSVSSFYAAVGADNKRMALLDQALEMARDGNDPGLAASILCSQARIVLYSDLTRAQEQVEQGKALLVSADRTTDGPRTTCLRAGGLLLAAEGDAQGAIREYRAALAIAEASPMNPVGAQASLLNDIGEQYFNMGRPGEALPYVDRAIAMKDSIGLGTSLQAVIQRFNRAAVVSRMGEVASAAETQREALARLDRIGRPLLGSKNHYANSLLRLARYEEALALFMESLQAAETSENVRWATNSRMQIGRTLVRMGRAGEAQEYLDLAEASFRNTADGQVRNLNMIALARVEAMLQTGDNEGASAAVDDLLSAAEYPTRTTAPGLSAVLWMAARVALAGEEFAAAQDYASASYGIVAGAARDESLSADIGQALLVRGKARLAAGDASGRDDLVRALTALQNGFGAQHPETAEARALLNSR